jgi:hypothetical protein
MHMSIIYLAQYRQERAEAETATLLAETVDALAYSENAMADVAERAWEMRELLQDLASRDGQEDFVRLDAEAEANRWRRLAASVARKPLIKFDE